MAAAAPGPAVDGREMTADQQVHHVLNRLAFGARPGDVARVRAMGVDRWIESQLAPASIEDPAVDRLMEHYPLLRLEARELVRTYPPPAQLAAQQQRRAGEAGGAAVDTAALRIALRDSRQGYARIVGQLQSAKVARAVVSERQLEEVMVDFWHNHFSVYVGKGPMRYYLVDYDRETIRPHALGSFRRLLGEVARSPAMLYYLDNVQSMADSGQQTLATARRSAARGAGPRARRRPAGNQPRPQPGMTPQPQRRRGLNENYARELLELHTLGVDGGYTQSDIIDVARAFTGWSIDAPRQGGRFVFRPAVHDAGPKMVLGTRLAAGRGVEDGEQVLDLLARHPSTARFIAHKLAVRFVSDSPPPALVERAAATFTQTSGDIRAVVRAIVTSPEFFSRSAYRAKVKSPFETAVSALRALGAEPDTSPRTAQMVGRLGQPLFGRQSPDGWPETGAEWMNTGAILNRINFGMAVASGRVPGARLQRWAPFDSLRSAPREAQVDAIVAALLGGDVSPDTRAVLVSGEHPFMAEAASLPDSLLRPRMERGRPALAGVTQVVGLALGSPEFQRR